MNILIEIEKRENFTASLGDNSTKKKPEKKLDLGS